MAFTRRVLLQGLGVAAALPLKPIADAIANLPVSEPIKITSYTAQRVMWLKCDPHGNLPKLYMVELSEHERASEFAEVIKQYSETYPLNRWHELKRKHPNAFTCSFPSGLHIPDTVESDTQYVLENELADRISDYYLPKLREIAPANLSDKLWIVRNYFFPIVRKELKDQKGVPEYMGVGFQDNDYLVSNPGIFTEYTEDDARELVSKLTTEPPDVLLQKLCKRFNHYVIPNIVV